MNQKSSFSGLCKTFFTTDNKRIKLLVILSFFLACIIPVTVQSQGTPTNPEIRTLGNNTLITISANGYYEITGTGAGTARVVVNQNLNNVNIFLNNATITPTGSACAFTINNGTTVNMTLLGANILTSGPAFAGLYVNETATLIINGVGKLTVTGGSSTGSGGGDRAYYRRL